MRKQNRPIKLRSFSVLIAICNTIMIASIIIAGFYERAAKKTEYINNLKEYKVLYLEAKKTKEEKAARIKGLVDTIEKFQSGNAKYKISVPVLSKTEIYVIANLSVDFEERNKFGLKAEWILAIIQQESLYNKYAISSHRCVGLMQLFPATAERVAKQRDFPYTNLEDVRTNIQIGIWYFEDILEMTGGNVLLSLHMYNWGENTSAKLGANSYPYRVQNWHEKIKEETS